MHRTALTLVCVLLLGLSGCTKKKPRPPEEAITLGTVQKVLGLDPAQTADAATALEVGKVYEGLLQYHYLKRPYALAPNLAESLPDVSSDGKTYTINLKKGVLFQDDPCFKDTGGIGRELEAEDVIYSFKRLADPRVAAAGWWVLDGKIAGLNAWREKASQAERTEYSAEIEGLKALDRYTIQIRLPKRSTSFMYSLAMVPTSIVPREAVEFYGKDFSAHPVGTGPFRLEEFRPDTQMTWVRSQAYRREDYPSEGTSDDKTNGLLDDAGRKLPLSDRIVVRYFVDPASLWKSFLAGEIDETYIPQAQADEAFEFGESSVPRLRDELKEKGISLQSAPELDVTYTAFNYLDPVVGLSSARNRRLRQALSMAVDPSGIIRKLYHGRAIPAQGPIPPSMVGYDPEFKNPYRQFDLAKAKKLLAKAGYPDGKGLPVLEYSVPLGNSFRALAEHVDASLGLLGVRVKINSLPWPEFQALIKGKKGQLWAHAWVGDFPDAESFLQQFYGQNVSNYANPEFNQLFEKALLLPEGSERAALFRQMVRLVVEDAPWIWDVHRIKYALIHSRLRNYKIHALDHTRAKYLAVQKPK